MTTQTKSREFALDSDQNERLANLAGPVEAHLRQIESRLGIEIANRGAVFRLTGSSAATKRGEAVIRALFDATADAARRQSAPAIWHRRG